MHTRHTATCTTDTDIDIIAREAYATAASCPPDSTQPVTPTQPTLPAAPPAISYTPSTGPTDDPDAYFDLDDHAVIALYAPA